MNSVKPLKVDTVLWIVAAASIAAVGVALFAQYQLAMLPCPWCIIQRVIFVAVALLCLVVVNIRGSAARAVPMTLILLLAVLGMASAVWQHFVASKATSCSLTVADRIISALRLDEALPSVFEVKASCADAAVALLGVPFDFWALGLFAAIAIAAGYLMVRIFKD